MMIGASSPYGVSLRTLAWPLALNIRGQPRWDPRPVMSASSQICFRDDGELVFVLQ